MHAFSIFVLVNILKIWKTTFFFISRGLSTEAELQNIQNLKKEDGEIHEHTNGKEEYLLILGVKSF